MSKSRSSTALAVIPAPGGSKGVLRKNVALTAGHSLLVRAITAAQQARSVSRVVVSAADDETAGLARCAGAEVIQRPADSNTDISGSETAVLHALDQLRERDDYVPGIVVMLPCTSPLTAGSGIDCIVQHFLADGADSTFSAKPLHRVVWTLDSGGAATVVNHDSSRRSRRQDFVETGAIYVMKASGFVRARHRFFGRITLVDLPHLPDLEIDDRSNLTVAQEIAGIAERHTRLAHFPDPIDAVVFDFDGVFTDNRVAVFQDGEEAVLCSRSDGWGLAMLRASKLPILVLSTEANSVVRARCDKLGLECMQGTPDKLPALLRWLKMHGLRPKHTLFVGNDVNDVTCMQAVGCGIAVADAHPSAKSAAKVILETRGGYGAIRELVDLVSVAREGR